MFELQHLVRWCSTTNSAIVRHNIQNHSLTVFIECATDIWIDSKLGFLSDNTRNIRKKVNQVTLGSRHSFLRLSGIGT